MSEEEMKEVRPVCRERFQDLERDLTGVPGDEFGIRKKVGIMWTAHLKRKEAEQVKKIAWDKLMVIGTSLLQSGLLVYFLSGGNS